MNLIIIYFFYGLAFFLMGVILLQASYRSSIIIRTDVLRPFAIFGLLHGIHEWYEMFIFLQVLPETWSNQFLILIRVILLAISFIYLIVFGLLVINQLYTSGKFRIFFLSLVTGFSFIFLFASLYGDSNTHHDLLSHLDVIIRIGLGVIGSILASGALFLLSLKMVSSNQIALRIPLRLTSVALFLYALCQLVVPPGDFFPANFLNTTTFTSSFGIQIQLARAFCAVLMTGGVIRSSIIVENERSRQFIKAKEAEIEAVKQAQKELREREKLQGELLRHVVSAQEEERTRIARELHDETAQLLTVFSLDLAKLKEMYQQDKDSEPVLKSLTSLYKKMSLGIRELIYDLRPAQLDDLGLKAALSSLFNYETDRSGLKINFVTRGKKQRLDSLLETVLFRIAQEGITNIIRHARVSIADVNLIFEDDSVTLEIIDHGIGFDVNDIQSQTEGFGLAGIRERIKSIGGTLELISHSGEGTTIRVRFPKNGIKEVENGRNNLNVS